MVHKFAGHGALGEDIIIEQHRGKCIVFINGIEHELLGCNAIKLANTLWDKPTKNRYTEVEMEFFGFEKKG